MRRTKWCELHCRSVLSSGVLGACDVGVSPGGLSSYPSGGGAPPLSNLAH